MPHNPFPDPAAVHPGEAEMLSAVLANLTDDLPKLVYADWLEERGDERGAFLREFTTAARSGGMLPKPGKLSNTWCDLIGITIVGAAKEFELPFTPDEWLEDAFPALTFTSERIPDTDLPIGASKFGGEPDVPQGFEWPEYGRIGPLSFLAQFNLSQLSVSPVCRELPRAGVLSVFYCTGGVVTDGGDVGGWQFFHFPDGDTLERRPIWFEPDAESEHPHPCQLTFRETLSLPATTPLELNDRVIAFHEAIGPAELTHMLLGNPQWLQGGLPHHSERKNGRPQYRHLLTLNSDNDPGWMWSDSGLLYFGVSADDLKAKRFDRTLFTFQCF